MIRRNRIVLGVASLGLAVGLVYAIRAAASGIPSTNALSYAGVLEDSNGPITGSHNIQVILYDAATAGSNLCQTTTAAMSVTDGHFSVQLPDACTTSVSANSNAWVDVLVDGSDTGRTKIGAVPYAVEANHTPNADHAATANAAGGALATALSTIQGEVHPASAFHAFLGLSSTPPSIPSSANTAVAFDSVEYDLATEYTAATGTFSPKNAGIYLVHCQVEFSVVATSDWAARLLKNGNAIAGTDLSLASTGAISSMIDGMYQLAAGDSINCAAFQNTGGSATLTAGGPIGGPRNQFSAARLY